jgi:hypothetical protein
LDNINIEPDCNLILGGDFNLIFNPNLDGVGGKPKIKESVKYVKEVCNNYDLTDIWRIRNPNDKRFTWRQNNPIIQRRLDFWLISNALQEDIENVDVIPAIKTDHSAIVLVIDGIDKQSRGRSFWKFNSSLLGDEQYMDLIKGSVTSWLNEFTEIVDPRALWDILKYKIRQITISSYGKRKAKDRKKKLAELEKNVKLSEEKCVVDPTHDNLSELEILKTEYDHHIDYITQGAILRSRAIWYEKGKKVINIFLI